jgi:hypothetical protein
MAKYTKSESEQIVRRLCHDWLKEQPESEKAHPSFISFRTWLEVRCSGVFIFPVTRRSFLRRRDVVGRRAPPELAQLMRPVEMKWRSGCRVISQPPARLAALIRIVGYHPPTCS